MRSEHQDQKNETRAKDVPGDAWWAGLGPVGGVVLLLIGLGLLAWAFLDLPGSRGPHLPYEGAKVLAIGAVVAGTTLLARRSKRGDVQDD
ncbi:hypothetical protein I2W78_11905 [Streptomyces spinoverrucosus]|uniref:hypothetical protein n=1 Tax=Streptomyces spinoverrucosus TaxID=284043 RepID=UPI0018C3D614|nr:hypothetical protein [Streptomyces spinoverrucosus]MBG0852521.1 hypothetical protein [Streptomyces spinoverrucosus]